MSVSCFHHLDDGDKISARTQTRDDGTRYPVVDIGDSHLFASPAQLRQLVAAIEVALAELEKGATTS